MRRSSPSKSRWQNAQDARKYAYDEYDKAIHRPWDPDEVTERYKKNFVEADRALTVAQAEYDQALASQKTYAYDIALLKQDVAQAERKLDADSSAKAALRWRWNRPNST